MSIRYAYKVAESLKANRESVDHQLQLNMVVTVIHLTIIFGTSIITFLTFRGQRTYTTYYRENTAYITLTAIQEIFLAYNMFFILDEDRRPDIVCDEN